MNKFVTYMVLGMLILGTLVVSNAAADVVPIPAPTPIMISEKAYSDSGLYSELNLTRLQINPHYSDMQLKPGESDKITVTVTNKDNKTITLAPAVVIPPYSEFIFDKSWVTIKPASADIEPDAKQEFSIEVNIPADADIGYYGAQIAFTDDEMPTPYPTSYPQYINTMQLSVNVWTPPNIQIQTRYINDRVEAGTEYDYEIKLKNIADNDITIDPKISENNRYMYDGPYGMMSPAFEADAITITGPNMVKAGGTAVVSVRLTVPDDAKGRYSGAIDLNIDDPSIREWDGQVGMNFEVWTQPTAPYTKAFTARTGNPITIELNSRQFSYDKWMGTATQNDRVASFDGTLIGPSGEVEMNLVKTTYSGSVNLGMSDFPPWEIDSEGIYQEVETSYSEIYTVPGEIGDWTLEVLPVNVDRFTYSITIG